MLYIFAQVLHFHRDLSTVPRNAKILSKLSLNGQEPPVDRSRDTCSQRVIGAAQIYCAETRDLGIFTSGRPQSPTTRTGLLKNHRRSSGACRRASAKIGRAAAAIGADTCRHRFIRRGDATFSQTAGHRRSVGRKNRLESELQSNGGTRRTRIRRNHFASVAGNAIAMGLINDPGTPRVLQNAWSVREQPRITILLCEHSTRIRRKVSRPLNRNFPRLRRDVRSEKSWIIHFYRGLYRNK